MASKRLDIILGAKNRTSGVLSKVEKSLGQFAKRAALFGAAGAAAAAAGLVVIVNREREAIDKTAKLSAEINIATEDLIGYQKAAELTGVGASSLNSLLSVMSKRLGEAALGMGSGKKGLELLGIEASEIVKLDTAEQFKLIAERVSGLDSSTERAAATSAIFSRAGLKLVNTLQLGREGLEEVTEQTKALGISYSNVDAAKVEAANDAIGNAKDAIRGLGTQLTLQVAPIIQAAADRFTEWATSGTGASERIAAGLEIVSKVVTGVSRVVDGFRVLWEGVKYAAFSAFELIAKQGRSAIGSINAVIEFANNIPGLNISTVGTTLADELVRELESSRVEAGIAIANIIDDAAGDAPINAGALFAKLHADATTEIEKSSSAREKNNTLLDRANLAATEQLLKMSEQLETIGLTNDELQIRELRLSGASEALIEEARLLQDQLQARRDEVDLIAEGKRLAEGRVDAEEETRRQIEAVNAALTAGEITRQQASDSIERITRELAEQTQEVRDRISLTRASGESQRLVSGVAGGRSESAERVSTLAFQRRDSGNIQGMRDDLARIVREVVGRNGSSTVTLGGLL